MLHWQIGVFTCGTNFFLAFLRVFTRVFSFFLSSLSLFLSFIHSCFVLLQCLESIITGAHHKTKWEAKKKKFEFAMPPAGAGASGSDQRFARNCRHHTHTRTQIHIQLQNLLAFSCVCAVQVCLSCLFFTSLHLLPILLSLSHSILLFFC